MKWLILLLAMVWPIPAFAGDVYVLAINGGGNPQENYASHLAHLQQWVELLTNKQISQDHIVVLASDGADPMPDVLVRDPDPDGIWLLEGTSLGNQWNDLNFFQNSALPGFKLRPATYRSLLRTLADFRRQLRPGDTLLLYVTDHGLLSRRDPLDNQIVLWGNRAGISVRQLGHLLAYFPRDVKVISLMSQCFSGGFAYLGEARNGGRLPNGNTCGFFSSTPDRPAYGCYPEINEQNTIGHSFEFFSALAKENRLIRAHNEVLQNDDSPDIPIRSSDIYWALSLTEGFRGKNYENQQAVLADQYLAQAVHSDLNFYEWQLAHRIAKQFSLEKKTKIIEIDRQIEMLTRQLNLIQADVKAWSTTLSDFNESSIKAFLADNQEWRTLFKNSLFMRLSPHLRRQRLTDFISVFYQFIAKKRSRMKTAERLSSALHELELINYRTEVRIAVLTRIRLLYLRIAGQWYGRSHPDSKWVKAALALEQCEAWQLPGSPETTRIIKKRPSEPFPALLSDERERASLRPSWLGMVYRSVDTYRQNSFGLLAGAVFITQVIPGSPAEKAGLQRGDVVTHINGQLLEWPGDVRALVTIAVSQRPIEVTIQRRGILKIVRPILTTSPDQGS